MTRAENKKYVSIYTNATAANIVVVVDDDNDSDDVDE